MNHQVEYMFAYNPSVTKVIFLFQPKVYDYYQPGKDDKFHQFENRMQYIEHRTNLCKDSVNSNKIGMFHITKKQINLMNRLEQIGSSLFAEVQRKIKSSLPNQKLNKELEEQNEIVELIYLGEITHNLKIFRQVLVVKRRECQMMLTNGF